MKNSAWACQQPGNWLRGICVVISTALLIATPACGPSQKPLVLNVPTPDCGAPTLTIDTAEFRIESSTPKYAGTIDVPPAVPNVAYQIQGLGNNSLFVISPAGDNIRLEQALLPSIAGKTAKVTWTNCNSTTYTLSNAEDTSLKALAQGDLSADAITIAFQTDASGAASVVRGQLSGEEIRTVDTPTPGGTEVQAEISPLESKASADGKSVDVRVSILNTGASSFELTANDVSLAADGVTSGPVSSKPGLPQTFKPNGKKEITFTFARPDSATATLKIFDVEYNIEGY